MIDTATPKRTKITEGIKPVKIGKTSLTLSGRDPMGPKVPAIDPTIPDRIAQAANVTGMRRPNRQAMVMGARETKLDGKPAIIVRIVEKPRCL